MHFTTFPTNNMQPTTYNTQLTTTNTQLTKKAWRIMMNFRTISLVLILAAFFHNPMAFSAQFNFTPRATATSEYTDNVFLTKDDTDDDFITRVSAGFTAELLGKTSGVSLSFDPGYVFYQEFTDRNTWRIPADLRAWTDLTRATRLEFSNNFLRTEDPVAQDRITAEEGQVEETGDTTVRRGREPYYRNRARVNISHQFGREDRVYAGFLYGLLRNDDDQIEDNDEYRPSVGLDYWFSRKFGSQFFGEYTRGEYDQQSGFVGVPSSEFDNWLGTLRFLGRMTRHFSLFFQYDQVYRNFTSGIDNDYVVYAPSAGFTYDITEDMYLRLGLGYYWQDIENEKNNNDPFLNGEISKTWDFKRGSINLTGLSGLTQNDFGAQNIGFQQFVTIQGTANYNFTRQIVGDIGAYYRYSHTPAREDEVDEDDLDTNRYTANVGIGYLPTRWMNIRLGYEFNNYDTNADDDYTEHRALLTITLQPDQPWRF